jgi:hypothetical protein
MGAAMTLTAEARREAKFAEMRARLTAAKQAEADRRRERREREAWEKAARAAAQKAAKEGRKRDLDIFGPAGLEPAVEPGVSLAGATPARENQNAAFDRSLALSAARPGCVACLGSGIARSRTGELSQCLCVLRHVFRVCLAQYREYQAREKFLSRACMDFSRWQSRRSPKRWTWARPREEFCADLYLIAKRTLTELEWRLFQAHHLGGAGWRACCPRLQLDRGQFFHAVYRVEAKLGRAFLETKPYGLYPIAQYFT